MRPIRLSHGGRVREVSVDGGGAHASIDAQPITVAFPAATGPVREALVGGKRFRIAAARSGDHTWVWCEGRTYAFEAVRAGASRRAAGGDHHGAGLAAPMPGRVRRILAIEGARLTRGEVILVLEAMKMEHSIRAPRDGVLKRIAVAEGDLVDAGAELAELE